MWMKQIPPSEFDNMNYWEFETYIQLMNDRVKEENKRQKEQQEEQESYQKSVTPKMPDFSKFSPGNMQMPKF